MASDLNIVIEVKGVSDLIRGLAEKKDKITYANERIVRKAGQLVKQNAQANFRPRPAGSASKSGKGWTYNNKGANAPQPPKPTNRSGALSRSIRVEASYRGDGVWGSKTGPTVIYGRRIELGYGLKHKYPFLAMGVEDSQAGIREIALKEWRESI